LKSIQIDSSECVKKAKEIRRADYMKKLLGLSVNLKPNLLPMKAVGFEIIFS